MFLRKSDYVSTFRRRKFSNVNAAQIVEKFFTFQKINDNSVSKKVDEKSRPILEKYKRPTLMELSSVSS